MEEGEQFIQEHMAVLDQQENQPLKKSEEEISDDRKENSEESKRQEEISADVRATDQENKETISLKQAEKNEEGKEDNGEESKADEQHKQQNQAVQAAPKPHAKASTPSNKVRHTVPQPFSLATEKRMSRERRYSADQFQLNNLSKSTSMKCHTQTSLRHEGISESRTGNAAARSTLRSSERAEKRMEFGDKMKEKTQAKDAEAKKSQSKAKEEEDLEMKKLRKSSTFKASPLPSFYHHKGPPPKPELKKMPLTRPKSPLLGQRSKPSSDPQGNSSHKTEVASKSASKTLSSSAKETIHKLLRRSWKAPSTQSKDSVKGSGAQNDGVVSSGAGNGLLVSG